jgi:C4-dicarboxylate-specific signal transduction histidine kinase
MRHQLGNSVNAIKVTLDVLQANYDIFDDAKKRNYLERGTKLVGQQQALIDALKSYSRYNVKERKTISFIKFWEHFLGVAEKTIQAENIKFIHNLEVGPCLINGENIAVQKVMECLLENAVEALEEKKNPRIELTALSMNDSVVITIKDNGSGIRKSDLKKIFIPLFTTKPGRMGMGLPIAYKLLSKMEGDIVVDSTFGRSTAARVWLRVVEQK